MTPVASSTPRPRNAIAVESRSNVAADGPERHHPDEDQQHGPLVARQRPERGERLPRSRGRLRRGRHLGPDDAVEHSGSTAIAQSVGTDEAMSQRPNPISTPSAARHLGAERVGGHRRQPERRRHAEAGDAREHQERAEPPAIRPIRRRACRDRQRRGQRVQHAGPRRVARERRRDDRVEQRRSNTTGRASIARTGSRSSARRACRARTSPRRSPPGTRRR